MEAKTIEQYYKDYSATGKDKHALQKELLYQLYKRPTKDSRDNTPTTQSAPKNAIHQADILYLPNDDGYKYALTVVDVGSRLTECEPLKVRDSKTTLGAIKKIYNRRILSLPTDSMQVDAGTEFQKEFKQYFESKKITVRVAETGRHRQQALVESRNGSIARILLGRQTAEELITKERSVTWVKHLPKLIELLNKKFERKTEPAFKKGMKEEENPDYEKIFGDVRSTKGTSDLIPIGAKVRFQLDEPRSVVDDKKLYGGFRAGDIRWSMNVETVERYQLRPNQPPLYKITNRTNLFTKNQLQAVSEDAKLPPESVLDKYIIDKILEKRKSKGKVELLILWKDYKDPTWEPRSEIIKDVPQLVKEFEKSK